MVQFEPHHLGLLLSVSSTTTVGKFRLGASALGGSDVLGNSTTGWDGYSMEDFSALVTEINYENAVALTNIQDNGGDMSVEIILASDSDPLANKNFRVGSKVQLGLKNYVPGVAFQIFFNGFMKSIQTSVDGNGLFRTVIVASDYRELAFNQLISNFDEGLVEPITFATRVDNIKTALKKYIASTNTYDYPFVGDVRDVGFTTARYPAFAGADISLGDLIMKTANGDGGWIVSQVEAANSITLVNKNILFSIQENSGGLYPAVLTIADNELNSHVDVTSINRETDTTQIINNIKASLETDPATTSTFIDQDSIDLYGQNSMEVALDVFDQQDLDNYTFVAGTATTRPKIKSVTIDAIAHKNRHLHEVWKLYPSSPVKVEINQPDFVINERYLVTRVAHHITPELWETELELWRTN